MSDWVPSEEDLTRFMHAQMEAAYGARSRVRCSREDFTDGFIAALRILRSASSFRPGRFEPPSEETP